MRYFLIPSYNDSENIDLLFKNIANHLKGQKYKIILVDDGSTDKTKETIKIMSKIFPVQMIGYKKNKGPGYAFKYGFDYLIPKLKHDDLVITMEADNTADYNIIQKMLKKARRYDVVLASPYAKGGAFLGINKTRMLLGQGAVILDQLIFKIKDVKTYSSFYRIYKSSILKKTKKIYAEKYITEYGFTAVVELLIRLSKIGASFYEVPSIVDWRKRQGKSKMDIKKTISRHLNLYKKYLLGKYNL